MSGRLRRDRAQSARWGQRIGLTAALCAAVVTSPHVPVASPRRTAVPSLLLWAWERPADLRALDPSIGVAFLAQTLSIRGGDLSIAPRRQPLQVDPGTTLAAVTRIESPDAALGAAVLDDIAARIAATAAMPRVSAVQIDFDATASQRASYRRLLRAVRAALPERLSLSITALASWCVGDRWLADLPIDEAVPMLFRMGPADEPFRALAASSSRAHAACHGAVGVSLDEPLRVSARGRRVYVFNNRPWTEAAVALARRQIRQ